MTAEPGAVLARVFSGKILRNSLIVALVVGTVLNAINQGDVILTGGAIVWWKLLLTYAVPFFVTSFGAYSALR